MSGVVWMVSVGVWRWLDHIWGCLADVWGSIDVINSWIEVVILSYCLFSQWPPSAKKYSILGCLWSVWRVSEGVWMVSFVLWLVYGGYICQRSWKKLSKSRNIQLVLFFPVTSNEPKRGKSPYHTFHWSGGFFLHGVANFATKWFVLVHYKLLEGWRCQILISPIYQYTLLMVRFEMCYSWCYCQAPLP